MKQVTISDNSPETDLEKGDEKKTFIAPLVGAEAANPQRCIAAVVSASETAEAAYRRGDQFEKSRKLMEAWATYCEPGKSVKIFKSERNI